MRYTAKSNVVRWHTAKDTLIGSGSSSVAGFIISTIMVHNSVHVLKGIVAVNVLIVIHLITHTHDRISPNQTCAVCKISGKIS